MIEWVMEVLRQDLPAAGAADAAAGFGSIWAARSAIPVVLGRFGPRDASIPVAFGRAIINSRSARVKFGSREQKGVPYWIAK